MSSFWVAQYKGRKDVYERDVNWAEVPRRGMTQLILVAPNGKSGVLGHSSGRIGDRAFQFKIARAAANGARQTDAQVIGLLLDQEGRCVCYAWEYATRQLLQFEDNLFNFFYGGGVMATPSYEILLGRSL